MAKPAKAASKEETHKDCEICWVLVLFVPATFYTNYLNHVARQLFLSPPVVWQEVGKLENSQGGDN
ncbi:hypothetical protein DSO57_1029237 [Entomophthora muscae]|uniref:Uncharacterized protein n=1 Tax=Entomophthora muscae TaxID=34485 RepID=A0ACC2RG09_9FUNG|nr:hypothetical protein DSO57_1029237 [Entomophthora muscae]